MPAHYIRTMKLTSWATLLSFIGPVVGQVSTIYNPVREYSGPTFFDRWTFYGNIDNTTWGEIFPLFLLFQLCWY